MNNEAENIQIENNNPLSVRVDAEYKEIFNKIINEKGITKKQLMESMISNFIQDDSQQSREEQISFVNEINLISTNIDEIFRIFKVIANKSQDTLASVKDQYEQKLVNMNSQIDALRSNISELTERNNLFELTNNSYNLEREKLLNTIDQIQSKNSINDSEINKLNSKNQELLEQINSLRTLESQNHNLIQENEKINRYVAKLNIILKDKNIEIDILSKKEQYLSKLLDEFSERKQEEFKEIERTTKHEAELDNKMKLLEMQSQYNELQAENNRNLGIINQKTEEIILLKEKLNFK